MKLLCALCVAACAACIDPSQVASTSTDPLTFTHPDETITTSCDPQCDSDAHVLTLRYQSEIMISKDLLDDYAWLMRKARAASPATCSVSATATSDPTSIVIQPIDGQIAAAWSQGSTTTGVDSIDSPLGTIGISSIDASGASLNIYTVQLKQAVNVVALAEALDATQEVQAFTDDYNTPVTQDITAARQGTGTLLTFSSQNSGTSTINVTDAGVVTVD